MLQCIRKRIEPETLEDEKFDESGVSDLRTPPTLQRPMWCWRCRQSGEAEYEGGGRMAEAAGCVQDVWFALRT